MDDPHGTTQKQAPYRSPQQWTVRGTCMTREEQRGRLRRPFISILSTDHTSTRTPALLKCLCIFQFLLGRRHAGSTTPRSLSENRAELQSGNHQVAGRLQSGTCHAGSPAQDGGSSNGGVRYVHEVACRPEGGIARIIPKGLQSRKFTALEYRPGSLPYVCELFVKAIGREVTLILVIQPRRSAKVVNYGRSHRLTCEVVIPEIFGHLRDIFDLAPNQKLVDEIIRAHGAVDRCVVCRISLQVSMQGAALG